MTERADKGLAFLLQYENVAWYDAGEVRILDRRVYPNKVEYVSCKNHREVAQAIADMVTQSAGPYTAAAMGMALAAWECRKLTSQAQLTYLTDAAYTLSHARPTTASRMTIVTNGCLSAAEHALAENRDVAEAIKAHAVAANDMRYNKIGQMAKYLADVFPDDCAVMTHCYAETIVGQMLKCSKALGKRIRLFCPETRPYFQGSRLTAAVGHDMGFDVTVITDSMCAFVMQHEKIDVFTSAADVICMDGHVVNKVGTFQIAIAAKYMGIPYFVTGAPDQEHSSIDTVNVEMRNPEDTLQAMGVRTACQGVKGYYPAFDITPPHLVSGVVTDQGIYAPYDLHRYYAEGNSGEYIDKDLSDSDSV